MSSSCTIFELPKMVDPRGNLTFVESNKHIPFNLRRVFYIYGVPEGESRGAHAHKELHQMLICIAGKFKVSIDDGKTQKIVTLDCPWKGLHIPPMIWASEVDFSAGAVCLVLTSDYYSEDDYIRNYEEYLQLL